MTNRFIVTQPYRNIWHVQFPSSSDRFPPEDIALHFLRFQEHYESPRFRGKVFTWLEYITWYMETYGAFTYPQDWNGFNFPGCVLTPFRKGRFNPLTDREKALLGALKNVKPKDYVIGTREEEKDTIDHELAHALWYTNRDYREEVFRVLDGGKYDRQYKVMLRQGYDHSVLTDELQAYAISGGEEAPSISRRQKIRKIFQTYIQKEKS